MIAQDSPKQTEMQTLADQVAMSASTPLARFVPSASARPDRSIDEWVEREQRRGRCSIRLGLGILAGIALAASAWAWLS